MYQDTGNPKYQAAFQALTAATNGSELGSALTGAPTAGPGKTALKMVTEIVIAKPVEIDAVQVKIELNARRDDAEQYVNTLAPVQVPNVTQRNDNDFYSPVNHEGKPKASIDEQGTLNAANPQGTGDIKDHVRGGNPEKTPYISTTDNTITDSPKDYGNNSITVNTRQLQRDINDGTVDGNKTEIVPPLDVQTTLQNRVDVKQREFDNNPSSENQKALAKSKNDLYNAERDGECLIKGCVAAPYIQLPAIPRVILPILPSQNLNPFFLIPNLQNATKDEK